MSEIVTYAKAEFFRKPNLSENRMYRIPKSGLNTRHDNREVTLTHLTQAWHKRKLCALTNRPPSQSTRTGQWLSTLFHANCSAAQVYVVHPWQFIFALTCRRRSVLQVQFFPLSANKVILKNFLYMWWWQIYVMVKACLNQEIIKISNLIQVKENSACPKS